MTERLSDRSKTGFDWLTDQALLALVIVVLTLILGVFFSEIQSRVGWRLLVLTLGFVAIYFGLVLILLRRPIIRTIEIGLSDLRGSMSNGLAPPWLLSLKQLIQHESTTTAPEVWLVSADLKEDAVGGPFQQVVRANIERGIRYAYFVPDSSVNRARIRTIEAIDRKLFGKLRTVWLPDTFFFLVQKLDIVIYNPLSLPGSPREAFMGVPVPGEEDHFHVAVTDDFIDGVVGTLIEYYRSANHAPGGK